MERQRRQKRRLEELHEEIERQPRAMELIENVLWETLLEFEGEKFLTYRGMEFEYTVKGGEMFFSRKQHSKSITRSTVRTALEMALEIQQREGLVAGPKKLGTFGASYLYPIFCSFGIIEGKKKADQLMLEL